MSLFDDNPSQPPQPEFDSSSPADQPVVAPPANTPELSLPGDPISYAGVIPAVPPDPQSRLPEDLRIPWSWLHLIFFIIFGVGSLIIIQFGAILSLSGPRPLSQKQLQQLVESNPRFIIGTNLLWFALLFLFLYVTLSVLRDLPFWRSLGWRKLAAGPSRRSTSPWAFFFGGCGLAIFVFLAGSQIHQTSHLPIEDFLKTRTGALLLNGMAVLVAPLVEETIFRGYLYPFLAGKFFLLLEMLGVAPAQALRFGTGAGVVITGALFGMLHGQQLAWTLGFVSLLTVVGIVFTFVRARTGTVFASYLLHLGYNSLIVATSFIATRGFTHFPVSH